MGGPPHYREQIGALQDLANPAPFGLGQVSFQVRGRWPEQSNRETPSLKEYKCLIQPEGKVSQDFTSLINNNRAGRGEPELQPQRQGKMRPVKGDSGDSPEGRGLRASGPAPWLGSELRAGDAAQGPGRPQPSSQLPSPPLPPPRHWAGSPWAPPGGGTRVLRRRGGGAGVQRGGGEAPRRRASRGAAAGGARAHTQTRARPGPHMRARRPPAPLLCNAGAPRRPAGTAAPRARPLRQGPAPLPSPAGRPAAGSAVRSGPAAPLPIAGALCPSPSPEGQRCLGKRISAFT